MHKQQQTENAVQLIESVQEVSKQTGTIGHISPTHLDYWRGRIFRPTYSREGATHTTANYSCKIQAQGRRESFALHTSNADAAARKAREIYLSVIGVGWDETVKRYKPKVVKPVPILTVGEFIRLALLTGLFTSGTTFMSYISKLRTLVAWMSGIGSGRAKGIRIREWRAKVDQQMLNTITLTKVKDFKRAYLARFVDQPIQLRHAQVTMDGYIRNLRALFREEVIKEIAQLGVAIPPMPFQEVSMSVKGLSGFAYSSKIEAQALMRLAIAELSTERPEEFKIFIFGLLLGLRRGEIDQALWTWINWERGHMSIEAHEFLDLKTVASGGDVAIEQELLDVLRLFKERATGPYIVESKNNSRRPKNYRHYRCESSFKNLNQWLRDHGVKARCPLHTLRKECGSLINEKWGLVAASKSLRHASIKITATYYVAERRKTTTGLGALLPKGKEKGAA